jgi:RNA polymerase sigma-70 factor (ECF subfamily)
LLYYWARRLGLQESDAADLVQDAFVVLVRKLPEFHYEPGRSFRNWLRTVLVNKWRERIRRTSPGAPPADPGALGGVASPEEVPEFEEAEYRRHLVRRALELMQSEFSPRTWKACWEHVAVGRPADEVAAELGIRVGSVYMAKSRVLARLRQELNGLLD